MVEALMSDFQVNSLLPHDHFQYVGILKPVLHCQQPVTLKNMLVKWEQSHTLFIPELYLDMLSSHTSTWLFTLQHHFSPFNHGLYWLYMLVLVIIIPLASTPHLISTMITMPQTSECHCVYIPYHRSLVAPPAKPSPRSHVMLLLLMPLASFAFILNELHPNPWPLAISCNHHNDLQPLLLLLVLASWVSAISHCTTITTTISLPFFSRISWTSLSL